MSREEEQNLQSFQEHFWNGGQNKWILWNQMTIRDNQVVTSICESGTERYEKDSKLCYGSFGKVLQSQWTFQLWFVGHEQHKLKHYTFWKPDTYHATNTKTNRRYPQITRLMDFFENL